VSRLFAWLLYLYPASFRRAHGAEMLQLVRTVERKNVRAPFNLIADLLCSLPREWAEALRPTHIRSPSGSRSHPPRGESMRNISRDVALASRMLVKSPAFSAAAVLTLALGIGANTAMFTLVDATLLRPLQVQDPEELFVWSWTSSYPDYDAYTRRTDLFSGVIAVSGAGRMNFVIDGAAELTSSTFVSGNAFDVLGVRVVHGRALAPSDDVANGPLVAVLGFEYWRRRFGADPDVVGRTFRLNGRAGTIVGVAEQGFRGISVGTDPSIYMPTGVYNQVQTGFFSRVNALTARGFVWLDVIGRLQPGVAVEQAESEMTAMYARLHPSTDSSPREELKLTPLRVRALGRDASDVRAFVALLLGVAGLTLLIGCANLASLLLAKASARRQEMGIRVALGATRGRVVQQMLTESVLLSVVGGAVAIGVAAVAVKSVSAFQLPGGLPIGTMRLTIDSAALTVASGLSLATGLLFGVLPALRASRSDVLVSLRDEARSSTSRSALRSVLLAGQIALSLVLLVGAGLFVRGLSSALAIPLGFEDGRLLTASVNLGLARYDDARAAGFFETALERVRALPQVESAAWGNLIPTRGVMTSQTEVEGYAKAAGEVVKIHGAHVGPGYFRTVGTRVLAGREVSDDDRPTSPPVAVINEHMAETYWAGRNPVGGRFKMFDRWVTVVGVVENTVVQNLGDAPVPHMYLAFDQWLTGRQGIASDPAHLFVRTRVDPGTSAPLVREQLRGIDPELPLYDVTPLSDRVARLVMPQRMGVTLMGFFSALALVLAAVGIYGVASYVASLRTREIGIRMALGATRGEIGRLMLRETAVPVAIGITAGLCLALWAGQLAASFLMDVSPRDPLALAAAVSLLAVVALVASYVPARRAGRLDPQIALRDH
jgi:predicted permease